MECADTMKDDDIIDRNGPGFARNDHPDTAKDAADDIASVSGAQRRAVYDCIMDAQEYGRTDQEIQLLLHLSGNAERPRRTELVKMGKVVDSGRTRTTHSNRQAVVWVGTGHGWESKSAMSGESLNPDIVGQGDCQPTQGSLFDAPHDGVESEEA